MNAEQMQALKDKRKPENAERRLRVSRHDKMIAKAQRMLDSGADNEYWERELMMVTDERQWIIDGDNSL